MLVFVLSLVKKKNVINKKTKILILYWALLSNVSQYYDYVFSNQ